MTHIVPDKAIYHHESASQLIKSLLPSMDSEKGVDLESHRTYQESSNAKLRNRVRSY